ncbi:MAG: Rid family hydrolase [Rhodospirillales bacterium]|nr:Rid family hydrolase [Rhodospirillales bacterium]
MRIQRFRKFNTRDVYPGGRHDNDMCMTVRAGNRIFLRGQTGFDLEQAMCDPADPAAQANQAMTNARVLLEEAGSSLDHVTMVTTYLTDPAWRLPVYRTVAEHLRGNHTVGTGLIVKGLALPEMKVEIDLEAVIPRAGPHRKHRLFNSRHWFGQTDINRDSCWLVDTGDEIFLRGQTGAEFDGRTMRGTGFTVADAAAQADQAMQNARTLLEEAGSGFDDVMKTRIYIGDRAYREVVYQAIGRHLGDTCPCSTGLIMRGFARPEILFEIDMAIIRTRGTPHQRLHRFHTDEVYKDGQKLGMRFCKSVRAGNVVHLRGQTGVTLDGEFPFPGDPAAQADQAMKNIAVLLEEAGASVNDICKVHTFILHRAHREAVYRAIGRHLKGVHPCGTGIIVDGFARPEILVEVDVVAVIQG